MGVSEKCGGVTSPLLVLGVAGGGPKAADGGRVPCPSNGDDLPRGYACSGWKGMGFGSGAACSAPGKEKPASTSGSKRSAALSMPCGCAGGSGWWMGAPGCAPGKEKPANTSGSKRSAALSIPDDRAVCSGSGEGCARGGGALFSQFGGSSTCCSGAAGANNAPELLRGGCSAPGKSASTSGSSRSAALNSPDGEREGDGWTGGGGGALMGARGLLLCPVGVPHTGQTVGFPQSSVVQFRHRISTALIFVPASLRIITLKFLSSISQSRPFAYGNDLSLGRLPPLLGIRFQR